MALSFDRDARDLLWGHGGGAVVSPGVTSHGAGPLTLQCEFDIDIVLSTHGEFTHEKSCNGKAFSLLTT